MDATEARALLAAERERLERALADAQSPPDRELADVDQHDADDATTTYDRELDEGLADDLRAQLAALARAEQRLADGSYGRSVESGMPIPDERLRAQPAAERTVEEERAAR